MNKILVYDLKKLNNNKINIITIILQKCVCTLNPPPDSHPMDGSRIHHSLTGVCICRE